MYMNARKILIIIFLHFVFFVLGSSLFISLFHTPLFINTDILFYRGILLIFLTCLLITLLLLYFKGTKYGKHFTFRDIIISVVIIFSANLLFFTHIPVTADRSISIFLLGYMNSQPEKAFTKDEIEEVFVEKYVYEHQGVDKRFNEQVTTGNILNEGNKYKITKQGIFLIKFYKLISNVFSINQNNISFH